ncbi:MAG: hypothetical protein A2148_10575 [Chloroflexi bacterium RBG_16_68_14]|nr:MAG: hypothetical protein A2148_10575 [Chloroflexi bacterium RBG_16_68_14]
MNKTVPVVALLTALLVACGGGSDSAGDRAIVDDLTDSLVQGNAEHYAFGCVDFDGTVLSSDYSPDAIADDANIELEHAADAWVSETAGVILGDDGEPQYIVIYDPQSGPTYATVFERREVIVEEMHLVCLVPKTEG